MKAHSLAALMAAFIIGVVLGFVIAFFAGVAAVPLEDRVVVPGNEPLLTVEYINTDRDEIIPTQPLIGQRVTSPLVVEGRARGSWYFEASAPMELITSEGERIAEGFVTAQENWMTEEFVTFEGTLTFTVPEGVESGTLILRADNPSGLPQEDRSVEIPVKF